MKKDTEQRGKVQELNSYKTDRIFLGRLTKGEDLLKELTRIVSKKEIKTGMVQVIGAVTSANFGFYNQDKGEYEYIELNQHLEIVSCMGNISILDGKPMIHAHIALADNQGNIFGGHLAEGTTIFASEAYIKELKGEELVRSFDEETGLTLW